MSRNVRLACIVISALGMAHGVYEHQALAAAVWAFPCGMWVNAALRQWATDKGVKLDG
jgi:hypothetical protein